MSEFYQQLQPYEGGRGGGFRGRGGFGGNRGRGGFRGNRDEGQGHFQGQSQSQDDGQSHFQGHFQSQSRGRGGFQDQYQQSQQPQRVSHSAVQYAGYPQVTDPNPNGNKFIICIEYNKQGKQVKYIYYTDKQFKDDDLFAFCRGVRNIHQKVPFDYVLTKFINCFPNESDSTKVLHYLNLFEHEIAIAAHTYYSHWYLFFKKSDITKQRIDVEYMNALKMLDITPEFFVDLNKESLNPKYRAFLFKLRFVLLTINVDNWLSPETKVIFVGLYCAFLSNLFDIKMLTKGTQYDELIGSPLTIEELLPYIITNAEDITE